MSAPSAEVKSTRVPSTFVTVNFPWGITPVAAVAAVNVTELFNKLGPRFDPPNDAASPIVKFVLGTDV